MARASCLNRESVAAPRAVRPQHLHRQPALEIGVDDLVDLGEAAATQSRMTRYWRPERAGEPVDPVGLRRATRRRQVAAAEEGETARARSGGSRCSPRAGGRGRTSRPAAAERLQRKRK